MRGVIDAPLDQSGRWLAARGATANAITLGGLVLGLVSAGMFWAGWSGLAGALVLLSSRLADGLDGAMARASRPTDRGAFLDIALDCAFYALFPLGFALGDPAVNGLPAAVLIASFIGTGSSFLAFASIAAKRGTTSADYPSKGIYYLGGLTEGAETIAVFAAMCVFPASFAVLAYGFATACALTTVMRWHQGWTAFR